MCKGVIITMNYVNQPSMSRRSGGLAAGAYCKKMIAEPFVKQILINPS